MHRATRSTVLIKAIVALTGLMAILAGAALKSDISIDLLGTQVSAPDMQSSHIGPSTLSTAFSWGDSVQTTGVVQVFPSAPTSGSQIASQCVGRQETGSLGKVNWGPMRNNDQWWWRVDFNAGPDGWVMERWLSKASGSSPSPSPTALPSLSKPSITDLRPANNSSAAQSAVTLQGKVVNEVYPSQNVAFTVNRSPVPLDDEGKFSKTLSLANGTNTFTLSAQATNVRQHPNLITSYLDGSVVYGSDAERAVALRTFVGGKLKTSAGNLMPYNVDKLPNANDAGLFPDEQLFLAGDVRANENVNLIAIHILFVREHNTLATAISAANPGLSDEEIYQRARKIVIAELQVVTYKEWLPALLGPRPLQPYRGYHPTVNPGIATEFSTAAFRFGHSMINNDVGFRDNDAKLVKDLLPLAFAFFNPKPIEQLGPDALLKYLATDSSHEIDIQLVGGLRNFLFGPPGAGGFDLAARNIQRGRDHGLPDFNTMRKAFGLLPYRDFSEITSDPVLRGNLRTLYGNVNNIDAWVGGLVEDHAPSSSLGETFGRIITDQFERLRDGDRFWYQRTFSGSQLAALEATRLSDIIRRNTGLTKLQDNVFFFRKDILPLLQPKNGSLPEALIIFPPSASTLAPSIDGGNNNIARPHWGQALTPLLRLSPAAYGDGISTPAGANRPSPRVISNTICVAPQRDRTQEKEFSDANDRFLSDFVYGWGQFIDHDIDLTDTGDENFPIPIPFADPQFDPTSSGVATMPFSRSNFDPGTSTITPAVTTMTYTVTRE